MSKIVIIGAGAMGSAFSLPCLDNNHDINIVGTHLENEFIDKIKSNKNLHPALNVNIPESIKIFKFDNWVGSKIIKIPDQPAINAKIIFFVIFSLINMLEKIDINIG